MRFVLALIVIIYLVGVGVVLAPTTEANWSTSTASQFFGTVVKDLRTALSLPVTEYRKTVGHD
jgi:hypothetical protein